MVLYSTSVNQCCTQRGWLLSLL